MRAVFPQVGDSIILCMIKIFRGAGVVTPSNPLPPYEQFLPSLTPCFKTFLERSLNDPYPPPPHFKHLSIIPPLIHHPFPQKILIIHLLSSQTLLLLVGNSLLVIHKAKRLHMNGKFWLPPQVKSQRRFRKDNNCLKKFYIY